MATRNILIHPAPDCPAPKATPPEPGARTRSRALIEFSLLTGAPYALDHAAFTHLAHQEMAAERGKDALDFAAFHQKGQPCMRASPLTKRLGWGAHYNPDGKLALLDPGSQDFQRLAADPSLAQKPALRNKRV